MKVSIYGIPFDIQVVDSEVVSHKNPDPLWGEINYTDHSIRVALSNTQRMQQTFWHELIHGIVAQIGITESLSDSEGRHNERSIDQLAIGISMALDSIGISIPLEKEKQ